MAHSQVRLDRSKPGRACAALVLLGLAASLLGARPAPPPRESADRTYRDQVRPFLARHCLGCHGAHKPKGDFRLDRLSADLADRERWLAVLKRVEAGEMPPKSRPRPPAK